MTMVSVIMPVYNGEEYIQESILTVTNYLKKLNIPYEVIVVDDGSKDKTYTKAIEIANKYPGINVKVIRYRINRGKGYALVTGYKYSKGDIITFFDADLDIPVEQLGLLIKVIQNAKFDVVITSKWHPKSKVIATKYRKFLSKAYRWMVRLLVNINVSDTQTGAKAFRRYVLNDVIPHLTVRRYAFDTELLAAITMRKYKIAEVPALWEIKLTKRFRLKEILRMFIDLAVITYKYRVGN